MNMKSLTESQKLQALAFKYYQGGTWDPKSGDYYTSSRADLELYKVVEVTDEKVKTTYLTDESDISEWDKQTFLTEGFGINRVWVPDWIFNTQPAPAAVSAGDPTAVANSRWPHETKEENEYITEAENRDRELIRRGFVWGAEWASAPGIPDVRELVEKAYEAIKWLNRIMDDYDGEKISGAEVLSFTIDLQTALAGIKRK